ncbi:hypothetical protein [Segatella maculosa]|nr:hypothetical protein [Segatella maculosa]
MMRSLRTIYRKLEMTDDLCLKHIKSEYLHSPLFMTLPFNYI